MSGERYLYREALVGIFTHAQAVRSVGNRRAASAAALWSEGDVVVYVLAPVHQHLRIGFILQDRLAGRALHNFVAHFTHL